MPIELAEQTACPFCAYVAREEECAIVAETELSIAFMNRTQYEHGGMLIVSRAHRPTVLELREDELADAHRLARSLAAAVVEGLGAIGVNIFQNNGARSGQHIGHYHVHLVPRYETSDPDRSFRQGDFEITPIAELQCTAQRIRAALR